MMLYWLRIFLGSILVVAGVLVLISVFIDQRPVIKYYCTGLEITSHPGKDFLGKDIKE